MPEEFPPALLVLEDGTIFRGRAIGRQGEAFGECVFNTSLTGYQEILTDPSYQGQIVAMTCPHIGNYGVNDEDVESLKPWLSGFVIKELSPIVSNHRATQSLQAYLQRHGVVAIDGVDTRALTLTLRTQGALRGGISTTETDPQRLLERVKRSPELVGADLAKAVTCLEAYPWPPAFLRHERAPERVRFRVAVMDFGVKFNILRSLTALGCAATVVPGTTSAEEILALKPDGVVLSNGPGDPAAVTYAIATIRTLLGRQPILGICLGHQLLGLAYGGKTYKLKFGHHGGNHPVKDLTTGQVAITAQNHGFAVDVDSIPGGDVELTHVNLNDQTAEGMRHKRHPIFSLQYHPESSPGPHDSRYLFGRFIEAMQSQGGRP